MATGFGGGGFSAILRPSVQEHRFPETRESSSGINPLALPSEVHSARP